MGSREDLLRILEDNRGGFVSGADLARELGVSGTAVWKAIRKLKSEGYLIEAVTNKGYRLASESDVLSLDAVRKYLDMDELVIDVFHSTDSTNNVCRDKASSGQSDGYIAIAANQTKGRGRRGRSFYSPDNTGLYLSMLLRPAGYTAEQAMRFTTMAAAAVCEAIETVSGKEAGIKWVNDVFMDGRKVCGILTEASFDLESSTLDYAIVGIGINVFTPEGGFPEEIRDIAGAIFSEDERAEASIPDIRSRLAAEVIRHFMKYYRQAAGYMGEYRKRCIVIGRNVNVIMPGADPRPALALDIDDECGLIVRYEDGSEATLRSGEISIRM